MIKKTIFLVGILLFMAQPAFCWEWKELHEQADGMTLAQALASVERAPDDLAALYVLGLVSLDVHQDRDADAAFAKILSLDPAVAGARWGRAEVLRREHKLAESVKILKEVMDARPEFASSYISLAYIRFIQRDFNGSVSLAQQILARGDAVDQSNVVRAHLLLGGAKGMIAHFGGPLSKVINGTFIFSHLREAQKRQPDSVGVFFGMGSYYLMAPAFAGGDLKEAEQYLLKAAAADPLFADTFVRLAQLYRIKGDDKKFAYYLNKALQIDPLNELALDTQSGACRFICGYKGQ